MLHGRVPRYLGSQMYESPLRRTGVIGSMVWLQRCEEKLMHKVAKAAHAGENLTARGWPDGLTVYQVLHAVPPDKYRAVCTAK